MNDGGAGHVYRQIYRIFLRAVRAGKFLGIFCALRAQANSEPTLDVLMTMPISSKLRDQLGMVVYPGQAGSCTTSGQLNIVNPPGGGR